MDRVRVRLAFLQTTQEEKDQGIIRAKVDPVYIQDLHAYGLEHRVGLEDQMAILTEWNWSFTKEARNFYFTLRDRIVQAQSGFKTKEECTLMHKQLKEEFGAKRTDGKLKSLKDSEKEPYTRYELWLLIRGSIDWLIEAGGSLAGLQGDLKMLQGESSGS